MFAQAREIVSKICTHFGIAEAEVLGDGRTKTVVHIRHLAMYFVRRECALSLVEIGRMFNKDHSSVVHGVRRIEREAGESSVIQAYVRTCFPEDRAAE